MLISPRHPDEAQALRDWGDFVHIRDIAAAAPAHFTMITPYEHATPGATPRYLHLYELDTDDPEPAFQAMTPTTSARVGAYGTHARREWAVHEALVIDYVNTFRRRGAAPPDPRPDPARPDLPGNSFYLQLVLRQEERGGQTGPHRSPGRSVRCPQ